MFLLVLEAAGSVSLTIWGYLLLARGGFWRAPESSQDQWSCATSHGKTHSPDNRPSSATIAAIIPARDEADVIGRAVTSLMEQSEAGSIRVFVVDDGSTDGTAGVALAAGETAGKSEALRVIPGQSLPPGWSGKLWALQQGIVRAHEFAPRYLLLTDADVVHAPDELSGLIELMEAGSYDLASLIVKLRCESIAEKLLMPALVFFFFQLYPPSWIADPRCQTAGAAGGCILIRPEALERAGGIAAVRGEVIDDCALAGAVKRSGGKLWLGAAKKTASIRAYEGFSGIGQMISRTAFRQLRHSAALLLLTILAMTLVYLLPVALVLTGRPMAAMLGVTTWLLMTVAYRPTVKYCGLSPQWALLLPAAALFYMGATVRSALLYWWGRGGEWKGRVQDGKKL